MNLRSNNTRLCPQRGLWQLYFVWAVLGLSAMAATPTNTTISASGAVGNYTLNATETGTLSGGVAPSSAIIFRDTSNGNTSLGSSNFATPSFTQSLTVKPSFTGGNDAWSRALSPGASAIGDFNRDGIPDLAVEDYNMDSISIFLGNGDGTFKTPSAFAIAPTTNSGIAEIMVADMNGDGNPDLIVTSGGSGGPVDVFLGNGNGTFTLKGSSGLNTSIFALGDFNRDGKMDAVSVDSNNAALYFLQGDGAGNLNRITIANVTTHYSKVWAGDFNGDGKLDLILEDNTNSVFQIRLGNGDGTFQAASTILSGVANISSMAVGDFNGDGKLDIAYTMSGNAAVGLGLGNGDGTFSTQNLSTGLANGFLIRVVSGDFNGDGKLDILTSFDTYSNTSDVVMFLGNGNGTFGSPQVTSLPTESATGLTMGDLNNDATPDLVISDHTGASLDIVLDSVNFSETASLTGVSIPGGGIHEVDAYYSGSANYLESTSGTVALSGSPIPTGLTLSAAPTFSAFGQQVALSATLSPSFLGVMQTNGETITFLNNGSAIGTAPLGSGLATLQITSLPVGTNSLTASYPSDGNFEASTSNSLPYVVTSAVSSTVTETPTSSVNPTTYQQATTLTAPVDTGGNAPTGSVNFTSNGSSVGSAPVTTISTTNLLLNSQQLGASSWVGYCAGTMSNMTSNTPDLYAPDGTLTATKFVMPSSFACGGGGTWGAIGTVSGGLNVGQTYTISVWLRGANGGEPVIVAMNDCIGAGVVTLSNSWQRYSFTFPNLSSGDVGCGRGFQILDNYVPNAVFYLWGAQVEQSSSVGPYIMTNGALASGSGGIASLTTAALPTGSDAIVASYNGDPKDLASSSLQMTQTVDKASTSLAVTSSPPSLTWGQVATVTGKVPAGATGTVSFTIAGITTPIPVDGTGSAVLTNQFVGAPIGSYVISAAYSGDNNYSASSTTYTESVSQASSTVVLSASPNPSTFGIPVSFTSTTPSGATGIVTFKDGAIVIGTAPITGSSAILTTSGLSVGSHYITAVYSGDTNFTGSTSPPFTQLVNKGTVAIAASSTMNPATYGRNVTFDITLSGVNGVTPTGSVALTDDGLPLTTINLDATGKGSFSISTLNAASHQIKATYSGDSNYQ